MGIATIVINDFVKDAAYGHFDEQAPLRKSVRWFTDVVNYDNRKEQRNQISEFPIRTWPINWLWIDSAARDKLVELVERAHGRALSFLYEDRTDNLCEVGDWAFTLTTGDTTTQLQKTYYKGEDEEWTEDRTKIQPSAKYTPTIYVDGAPKTEGVDYTLDDTTGLITWTGHTPSTNEVVTADYQFYFKVRLVSDTHQDIQHQIGFWEAKDLIVVEDVS
jgi:uncharacterized protein (TIGR02217 family)